MLLCRTLLLVLLPQAEELKRQHAERSERLRQAEAAAMELQAGPFGGGVAGSSAAALGAPGSGSGARRVEPLFQFQVPEGWSSKGSTITLLVEGECLVVAVF